MTTTAEFKTMLKLCTPVSILEEEIDDRKRGKMSRRSEFLSVILEAGLLLSDQEEKIIIVMTPVVPSGGQQATDPTPRAAVEMKQSRPQHTPWEATKRRSSPDNGR
jgi:hypothetical protein